MRDHGRPGDSPIPLTAIPYGSDEWKRLYRGRAARSGREMPARLSTFQTVEWAKPVAAATSRGPQPVCRRQVQIRSCTSGTSSRGLRCGLLERSPKQARVARACSLASRHRCHQRCAVAGETLNAAAAAFTLCLDRPHEREPASQSELGVTVKPHPGPS